MAKTQQIQWQSLAFQPLTPERWDDFVELFGPRGAYGGCWCMWWRTTRSDFTAQQGDGNRRAMQTLVQGGQVPGILAYADGKPAGWCSVAPREQYPSLARSRVLQPLDDTPVWSLLCLFVARGYRKSGLALALIEAAVAYVASQGGTVVEAYPTVPRGKRLPPVSSYMGTPELFARAGFEVCAQPSASRMIMRRRVGE